MSTTVETKKQGGALAATANYLDERVGVGGILKNFGRKVFPDHWSFMLGEVALYSFVILLISGTFLTFFYQPAMTEVIYDGAYVPLKGAQMSIAYASSLDISFEIRGGMLMRQAHHWSALLFVAAAGLHMLRVFFTGAFRKPREINWLVGFMLFILGMAAGFTGYSLPDDLLSGNGLRIIDGMIKGIPVIGTTISSFLFGGEFPGTEIVARLYGLHILLVPALILIFIAIHLFMVIIHKHTHYSGPGRTDQNVVGYPLMPVYVAKAGGFTGDKREHHVLDRPRNSPTRTGIGAAGVTFYGVLWAAASTDLIAVFFQMSLNHVLTVMQIMLIAGPFAAYIITKRTCLALQRKDREIVLHGRETRRIVRLPHGEYIEVHEPLDKFEMYKMVDFKDYRPTVVRPNKKGKIAVGTRIRAALSRFYFEDRIAPVTQTELSEAQSHDHSHAVAAPAPREQLTK